LEPGR
jgi:hypothetical protein